MFETQSVNRQLLKEPDWKESTSRKNSTHNFEILKSIVTNSDWLGLKQFLELPEYQELVNFQPENGNSLLHIAALQLDPECLKCLLHAGANPNLKNGFKRTPLHNSVSKGCRCKICNGKRLRCVELLIDAGSDPNSEDLEKETVLYYTAKNMYAECAKYLLKMGADLYHLNDKISVATLLAEYVPEVLTFQLDKCVEYDPQDSLKLRADFRLILQNQNPIKAKQRKIPPPETELLESVLKARVGNEMIITHPVVEAFLHFKWMAVKRFFFVLRSIYFIFVILYTRLMMRMYSYECIYPQLHPGPFHPRDQSNASDIDINCIHQNIQNVGIGWILIAAIGLMIVTELYKISQESSEYFSSTGCLWWILIFLWSTSLLPVFGFIPEYKYKWQLPFAAVAVIYSWLMNLVQLARMPWFAVHVGLFVKVVTDFVKLLVTFSTVLVAFALGFCILFPVRFVAEYKDDPFKLFYAIFKVFIMMKGDIDYDAFFSPALARHEDFVLHKEYSIPAHLIYGSFVVMVTLLLTALLIGLAVKDMEEIQNQAKVNRSVRLINEIAIFESLIRNPIVTCGMVRFFHARFSVAKFKTVQGYSITFSPIRHDDATLPQRIKEMFIPYLSSCECQQQEYLMRMSKETK